MVYNRAKRVIDMYKKLEKLKEYLKAIENVAVSFSGGVDSTFLLKVAHDTLGDNAIAVTAHSCSFPEREFSEAKEFCRREGIRHVIVETNELEIEGFAQNPENRCYICKTALFKKMRQALENYGFKNIAEGSNMDDNGDYRPGLIAVKEQGIISPLRYAELYKEEIRSLSEEMGLSTWDKPSFACLSSRFVYGELITKEKLEMVEKAEQYLLDSGFKQMRVRVHGNVARIEVLPEDFEKIAAIREEVYDYFNALGFPYVSLDLKGYRTGSMNETISNTR